jgi:hypothetical protein
MRPILRFFIISYLVQICLSATGIFDDYDLFASNVAQPDDGSQLSPSLEAPLANLDSYDSHLEPLDGLDLGGMDSDFNISPHDDSIQGQAVVPNLDFIAGGENECSSGDQPASRMRARGASCNAKKKEPPLDLKLPILDTLPSPGKKKLPSPSPINGPSWETGGFESPETCPMSFRGSYYIPVCGVRVGDVGEYTPTPLNGLRGWTVTDATICKSIQTLKIW